MAAWARARSKASSKVLAQDAALRAERSRSASSAGGQPEAGNAALPHPPAIGQLPRPAQCGEGGEQLRQPGFPCAEAGKSRGDVGFGLRLCAQHGGKGSNLLGER